MKWMGGILSIVLLLSAALIVSDVAAGESREDRKAALVEQVPGETAISELADLQAAYFAETQHNVRGAFAAFFWTHGAEAAVGKPLSEEFVDADTVRQVFEYVVLQRPLQGGPVRLAPIGDLGPAEEEPLGTEAGHATIAACFAGFYLNHGGEEWFGSPVKAAFSEGSTTVQVFQFGSLELHQDAGGEDQVRVGHLGALSMERLGIPAEAFEPASPWMEQDGIGPTTREVASREPEPPVKETVVQATLEGVGGEPTISSKSIGELPSLPLVWSHRGSIALEATVKYPQTGQGGSQILYITTRDSQGNRLGNVQVDLIVRYPNRDMKSFGARTGETGRAAVTFDIGYSRPGVPVLVDLVATRGDMRTSTQLGFTPWW